MTLSEKTLRPAKPVVSYEVEESEEAVNIWGSEDETIDIVLKEGLVFSMREPTVQDVKEIDQITKKNTDKIESSIRIIKMLHNPNESFPQCPSLLQLRQIPAKYFKLIANEIYSRVS